ncbi:MAG: SRPBCC family protein [Candidatus Obscuribacterales bacterium]|nr:SRPBCC family protein [Candidatus Obscuribacterales bacterium]
MFNFILMALLVPFGALLAFAAKKPDTFRVERELNMKTTPDKVFPYINDLHKWTSWSPYEGRDPEMKRTYSGADSGVGAIYEWDGNNNVGSGRMEILTASVPSRIVIKLDFFKPFEGHNTAEFTIDASGDGCNVKWAMYGPCDFRAKVMHCFMNIDQMCGKDFSAGLEKLKSIVES